ncbi:hypothetical protein P4V41_20715 [Fictibacillus nanhaiensis]|uniref:hypothetical protein n=1 Tax=Fictibacillus nanhaiensis TaxID=742169 RepID=UPI002E239C56|nr:hypothetical protein [Fictibacillus nanhaiensis]
MQTIKATHLLNVKKLESSIDFFRINIDHNDNVIVLFEKEVNSKYKHIIYHSTEKETIKLELPLVDHSFEFAQPFNGGWLLVSARTDEDEGYIKNATIFDEQQNVIKNFELGDGINNVQTTSDSQIWVSYFDEASGSRLKCFDSHGHVIFDFNNFIRENKEIPYMYDCYAMNVTSKDTNVYYYDSFPLLKIGLNKKIELHNDIPVEGCNAFAINGSKVLFSHDYDRKAEVTMYDLSTNELVKYNVRNQDNNVLDYDEAIGRGKNLYLIKDFNIYLIDMNVFTV